MLLKAAERKGFFSVVKSLLLPSGCFEAAENKKTNRQPAGLFFCNMRML